MRVALVGGVFGDPMGEYAASAPEAVLLRGLRRLGHDVKTIPVGGRLPRTIDADVIHAHHFGVAAYELLLAGTRPLVFTPHSGFLLVEGARTTSRLERALEELVLRGADTVVALSAPEAEILHRRYRVEEDRLAVIPNGLELERYAPAPPRARERVRLIAVGQMIALKGHAHLLDALADVRSRNPLVELTIVGHNQELRPVYEARCRELGIDGAVTFESLASDELALAYADADVFVHPSLVECFPITVAEAMASALPIVATDVGGVAAELGGAGIVVQPGDAQALSAAIERLVVDAGERARLGVAGAARARELFGADDVARRHTELYEGLASPSGQSLVRRALAAVAAEAYSRRGRISAPVRRLTRAT